MLSPRFLTLELKAKELLYWEGAKAQPRPSGFLGGLGYADPEIFDWVDMINAIFPGVCTLQSCSGHRHPDGHVWSGQLWLWLDEPMSRVFNRLVLSEVFPRGLALEPPMIERVNRIYHGGGQEIADIVFQGLGHGTMDDALTLIVYFLRRCHFESRGLVDDGSVPLPLARKDPAAGPYGTVVPRRDPRGYEQLPG